MTASILALDLGTVTGWALWVPGTGVLGGSQSFSPRRFDGGGMRYLRFSRWLGDVLESTGPAGVGTVCYEEVRRHLSTDSAHVYGGFMAVLTSWCEARGVPYEGVPVGTIKKFATGKGNAGKEQMVSACEGWGFSPEDHNHADAICLLRHALVGAGVVKP